MGKNSDKSSIERLEDIGLREVSRRTYIELSYLKLMANKEFSRLQPVKTLGFIRIIRREYGINMDDWLKEFEEYCKTNDQGKSKNKKTDDVLESRKNVNQNKKTYVFLAILFLVIFTLFAYNFTKGRGYIKSTIINSNISYYDESENKTDENIEQPEIQNIIDDTDKFSNENDSAAAEQPVLVTNDVAPKPIVENFRAVISPRVNIWVGIVDLSTLKKQVYLQKEDIELDLSKEQIIITGHGDFTLKVDDGESKVFRAQNRIYLYAGNGTVEEINFERFIKLNGGREW
jgi:hypothetical protein